MEKEEVRHAIGNTLIFALGVGVGFLTAPKTGRGTRAWLHDKTQHYEKEMRTAERRVESKVAYEEGQLKGLAHKAKQLTIVPGEDGYVDDVVTQRVRTKIGENPETAHLPRINVDTADQVVTLRGRVPSDREKETLEKIATDEPGVEKVINKVTVSRKKATG